jgi:hypothetical protein
VKQFIGTVIVAVVAFGFVGTLRAEGDKSATAVIDKAIKALGGEEKLNAIKAASWKGKGTLAYGEEDNKISSTTTVGVPGQFRQDFEAEVMGATVTGSTVLSGDKGWRKFNGDVVEMDKDAIANERLNIYPQLMPHSILLLKSDGVKVAGAPEEKVDDKSAVVLKVTMPTGKDFTIYFDKESGLPVKYTAIIKGFMNDEAKQETFLSKYKQVDGVQKATHVEVKRGGDKFLSYDVLEFKTLKEVDPATFAEPK